jgi:TonB family protein
MSIGGFGIDNSGQVVRVNVEADAQHAVPITDAKLDGSLLSFRPKSIHLATDIQCQMKLAGESAAELKCLLPNSPPGAPVGGWWKIFRQSDDRQAAIRGPAAVAGVVGGLPNGIIGGVASGGVAEGVGGGVTEASIARVASVGVIGGIVGGVSASGPAHAEEGSGAVSGIVFDPSGARVPQANLAIANKATGARESAESNDTGEFSFPGLPPGTYTLSATKVGFGIYAQGVVISSQSKMAPLNIILMPGDVVQAIDVTAPRAPGETSAPRPAGPQRIRVGGLIEATKLVAMKKPDYPESARAKGIQGVVLLQAVISKEGVPLSLKVISSPDPALSQAALDAVQEWRYEPTLLNGQPIEVVTTVAVRFHLED